MTIPNVTRRCAAAAAIVVFGAMAAAAQSAPESLKVYFATGSATVSDEQRGTLDQAARLFREGDPIVMILSGVSDTQGAAATNLDLSLRRARAVASGLTARGIPTKRLQVLGRGNSELEVDTADDIDEQENRVVEITWR